ncbi:uncharacterized protein LOC116187759 [Punica granatum]|uniref:Uncharacterized protein LOC116187759 n=1 Tax=Punica granatum TaxID=22663 RepID=A0A6P8BPA3_PUNGR|nr:uncharacterized protein LOC116187759 [Punica granatum]
MGTTDCCVNLKLLIDPENNRVLFAEAGKEFMDFVFHILALPLGTITQLINEKDMVGSIGSLYSSIENLNDTYMKSGLKGNLSEPKAPGYGSQNLLSLPAVTSSTSTTKKYYRCSCTSWNACREYVTESHGTRCPKCNNSMTSSEWSTEGGYVKDVVTYMVLDDLTVKPMSTISCISLLTRFNIKDLGVLEEREINVSVNEAVKLLKASLLSKRVLTDAFLGNKGEVKSNFSGKFSIICYSPTITFSGRMGSNVGGVKLKLLIDRENNRLLFAEAGKEFVDFMFYILALPVGTITQLINGKDMVGSIGNLYSSIENLNDTYMKSGLKGKLLEPKAPGYGSQNLLSLPPVTASTSTTTEKFYRCSYTCCGSRYDYVAEIPGTSCPQCRNSMIIAVRIVQAQTTPPVEEGSGYVKDVVTYMVLDDLTVKPMSPISCITLLTEFNIKDLGVLEEREINVSVAEAVKLLKASLQSKRVLTDAFLGNVGEVKVN